MVSARNTHNMIAEGNVFPYAINYKMLKKESDFEVDHERLGVIIRILEHEVLFLGYETCYDTSSTDDICSAPKFGSPEREKLIDEIHEFMLPKAPPVPQGSQGSKVQATIEENEIEGVEEELQNLVVEDGIVAEEPNETPSNAIVVQNSQPIAAMSTTELK
ncbi:ubiquitin-conjugating enzyme E2 32-like [Olea europaea var. sylvestris]|uniref:ubiquitin-conjugating enzyme E2 32-like n=1 Tax=Olea europaea var. sylvestris TaxID=158386 RepID=UPI000C1D0EC5|nr:ubiquitin-conjugating enzyme E2 32-like [Olea europaea var. sylvestris]